MKKYFIFIALLVLIFSIGSVCAEENGDNSTLEVDDASIEVDATDLDDIISSNEIVESNDDSSHFLNSEEDYKLEDSSEVIIVNNWDELQLYAGKTDKNYVVKLKENTNFYPDSVKSSGYQIVVKNNLTIIGSDGAYIGDDKPNMGKLEYTGIIVPDDSKKGITLENVTFKWVGTDYGNDGVFLQMGGNAFNSIKNCKFENINTNVGHSCIVYLKRGDATLENCTFINCTTDFGAVSIYDPKVHPHYYYCNTSRMILTNCYFENNYARTEPGCINNCGVITVYNCTFINNRAFWWAGAIHTHGNANTTIYNSNFIDNVAGWNGGALYTYSYLQIYNSSFIGNNCTTNSGGGAIGACQYLTSPHIYIDGCLFEDNANTNERGAGGAIAVMDNGDFVVNNSIFIHNNAYWGTAIAAKAAEGYGSPTVIIEGNKFINHTRKEEVIRVTTDGSGYIIKDNYYLNNWIEFSKISLTASAPIDYKVNVTIDASLKNPSFYDPDILDKCNWSIYVNGVYKETISGNKFTLDFEDDESFKVYVVPSICKTQSEEYTFSVPRNYIYVSKSIGNDDNDGLTNDTAVYSLSKAIEMAKERKNILLMDGNFNEENLLIDYKLTIWGSPNSSIGNGVISNSIFNVNNTKLTIKNMLISNLISSNDDSKLMNAYSSIIYLNGCIFKSNSANNLIESSELIMKNTRFENNNISLSSDKFTIVNSSFENNTVSSDIGLLKSNSKTQDWNIIDSNFINNHDLRSALIYYSSKSNVLNIKNSVFNNNKGMNNVSCIIIDDLAKLNIISSSLINNDENLPIILKINDDSIITIKDSVLINNSKSIGNVIIGELNNVNCDYNWWGNTYENKDAKPISDSQIALNNWLFLTFEYPSLLEHGIIYQVNITLDNLMTKEGNVLSYEDYNLPLINFTLNPTNITIENNYFELDSANDNLKVTLSGTNNGKIIINYSTTSTELYFNFIKSFPNISVISNEIMYGDNLLEIKLPDDATGSISIEIDNKTQTKQITNSTMKFDLDNILANTYKLLISYSGDEKYLPFEDQFNFTVNKYESSTKISVGTVKVSEDVVLTIEVPEDATGNITMKINGEIKDTININDSEVKYIIENITRGDWEIEAIYNGDLKYKSSQDYKRIEVEKIVASTVVNIYDISYGEDAEIKINMNRDATGNVTVFIDDLNETMELLNGKATVIMSNLNAGYKDVKISYTGDRYYASQDYYSRFYIEKIQTSFDIKGYNAKEGQNIIIELLISENSEGKFTINVGNVNDVIEIPPNGKVTWTTSKLLAGNYTVTATYDGQNYNTCQNSTKITVYSWNETQWPTAGYNSANIGKSPYNSDTNGEIIWIDEIGEEITGNLAIDSEGNIYLMTASGIYSYDKNGNQNWKYNSFNSVFSGIAIGREVIISSISGDTLYFINQTYGHKYGNSNIWQGSSVFTPVIDGKCNVYISGEKNYDTGNYNLVVVPYDAWEYGGLITLIDLGDSAPTMAPVVVNDNIVCVGTEEGLKIVDISLNRVISSLNVGVSVRPVVGDGGIIYALTSDELIAIDSAGNQLWKSNISAEVKYLAIDNENGLLYSIDKQGNLYKYDILDNGAETLISNLNITSGILIGNDGTLYVGADSTFIALDSDGKYLWKSEMGKTITGTPVMDADGNIYVTGNTTLFALTNAPLKDANLSIETANVVYGNDVKFNITLNNEATGEISVTINENTYIYNGNAEISIPKLTAGSYDVIVSYTGDKRFSSSQKTLTVNVTKIEAPASNITIPAEINTDNPSFSIELSSDATGILTVSVDGVKYSSQLNNGKATVDIPKLPSGVHNIVVTYSGDNNYDPITTSKTVTVPSPAAENPDTHTTTAGDSGASIEKTSYVLKSSNYKVKKSAKKLVLKATLKSSNGKPIKGKTITFKLNGKTYKAKTNKNGIAKVTIKKNVIKKLKVKKYTLKITYLKTTIKKTVTIKK